MPISLSVCWAGFGWHPGSWAGHADPSEPDVNTDPSSPWVGGLLPPCPAVDVLAVMGVEPLQACFCAPGAGGGLTSLPWAPWGCRVESWPFLGLGANRMLPARPTQPPFPQAEQEPRSRDSHGLLDAGPWPAQVCQPGWRLVMETDASLPPADARQRMALRRAAHRDSSTFPPAPGHGWAHVLPLPGGPPSRMPCLLPVLGWKQAFCECARRG